MLVLSEKHEAVVVTAQPAHSVVVVGFAGSVVTSVVAVQQCI